MAKPGCPLAECPYRAFAQEHSQISWLHFTRNMKIFTAALWVASEACRGERAATLPASHGQREFKILCPKCAFKALHPGPGSLPGCPFPSAKPLPADFAVLRSSGSSQGCLSLPGDGDPAKEGTKLLFFPRGMFQCSVL